MSSPVEIPLKAKYICKPAPRYGINGDHQGNKKPQKIGWDKHNARYGVPPLRVMVMNPAGHCRMVTAIRLSEGPHPREWSF